MTTPPPAGSDPEPPGQRRGLESYPEFFSYPIDPNMHETTVMPRVRGEGAPTAYQAPYPGQDAAAGAVYPETYIEDKGSGHSAAVPGQRAAQAAALQTQQPMPATSPQQPMPQRQQQAAPYQPSAAPQQSPTWSSRQAVPQPQPISAPSPQTPQPVPLRQQQAAPYQPPAAPQQSPAWPSQQAAPQPVPLRQQQAAPYQPPPQPPRPPRPRTARAPGRRRAKRSLAASLWPFQAFGRSAVPSAAGSVHIRSRSTTATVYRKLRADRAAVFGGCTIVVLILLAVFAPVVSSAFGVDPTTLHPELTDATFGPHGGYGGISWAHPLGVDQRMGRDILARLLSGARVSLLMAGGATLLSVGLGVALGVVSGYLGGRVDLVVMRVADLFLAFPLMLFALGLTGALSDQAFGLSGNALRIAIMIFVMGFFNWPYLARIVRAEVLSLRGREFVDAARAMGASTRWILWRELLPNLMAPILVYTTLLIPANIVFEAGLSALGIGLNPPASSWGQMMTDAVATVYTDPEYLIVPGMAVFITVLAFNLFGDGLRNATDPTAQ